MQLINHSADNHGENASFASIPMRTWLSLTTLVLTLSMNAWAASIDREFEIHGHRGCRGVLPENTLPAFHAALLGSIDVLEMDVAVTKDRILVISHDPFINPEICLNSDGSVVAHGLLINELTLEEVKSFDCGSIRNPRFPLQTPVPHTSIPTLEEVFDLVRTSPLAHAQKIGFNIETKIFPEHPEYTVDADEFAALIVTAIRDSEFLERSALQSFDPRVLIAAKALAPAIRTILLVDDQLIDMVKEGNAVNAYAISPNYKLLTPELILLLHNQGFKVIPWTVNQHDDWIELINLQVDGIITDYPQMLHDELNRSF